MKCYTWERGTVEVGVVLRDDEKLGKVVFLGEEGRGRRYEKIGMSRRNPAEVINNKVIEAVPVKITLPAKEGKPEKAFYILERPQSEAASVLIRVSTRWCYTRGSCGSWSALAGAPEALISGHGAHGDAGRIGSWDDGLVILKPGDALRVRPEGGYKVEPYVLWLNPDGEPQTSTVNDWENLQVLSVS